MGVLFRTLMLDSRPVPNKNPREDVMPTKRPLAERARWTSDSPMGPWWYTRAGMELELLYEGDGWWEASCEELGIEAAEFCAATLSDAKALAIGLVRERIRQLYRDWQC